MYLQILVASTLTGFSSTALLGYLAFKILRKNKIVNQFGLTLIHVVLLSGISGGIYGGLIGGLLVGLTILLNKN
jgi:hypothetical protein